MTADWTSNMSRLLDVSVTKTALILQDGAAVFKANLKRLDVPDVVQFPITVHVPLEEGPERDRMNETETMGYKMSVLIIHKSAHEENGMKEILWMRDQVRQAYRRQRGWITGHESTRVETSAILAVKGEKGDFNMATAVDVTFFVDETL